MMNNKKYSVSLANKDCIFDSESGFDSLAEVKTWVEQHAGRFRVMIDDEEDTFIKNHDPRANFVHFRNNTYKYYDGYDWVNFSPFRELRFQFEASPEGNILWAEDSRISVMATVEVPEGASEDYGYIALKKAILEALTPSEKISASFWYDGQEANLADDATAGEAEVEIEREG